MIKEINVDKAFNIDQVISDLEEIIDLSRVNSSRLGYFAALYHRVTVRVKEGIENNEFEDGHRMEELDVVFANRYIDAYRSYTNNETCSKSWSSSFVFTKKWWPIVLQHLLTGMNAHINLDLGIAAAQIMKGKEIDDLHNDFNKINEVLAELVGQVQQDLSQIWSPLKWILKLTGKLDNRITNFSMNVARDGAWNFAVKLSQSPDQEWADIITERDRKVSMVAKLITNLGPILKLAVLGVRVGEKGDISDKINMLVD